MACNRILNHFLLLLNLYLNSHIPNLQVAVFDAANDEVFSLDRSRPTADKIFYYLFFDEFGPDLTESSRFSAAQLQKAPADHCSRQGVVGHRGEELSESCRV